MEDMHPVHRIRLGMAMIGMDPRTVKPVATNPKLIIAIYPLYTFPFVYARELKYWLEEAGIACSGCFEPEDEVTVAYWNGTVEWFEGQSPMMVFYDPPDLGDLSEEDWEKIRGMGHFPFFRDPNKEKLFAWLRQHGLFEEPGPT